jgi:hypothetical protein
MTMIDRSFPAPPAQQASDTDDLLGIGGDFPLTAKVRRLGNPIEQATIITALVALAIFVVPVLLAR